MYEMDGFVVTLWSYQPQVPQGVSPGDYARALERLHEGMQGIDISTPRYTDRVAEALEIVEQPGRSPALEDGDRELLSSMLIRRRRAIEDRAAVEQLLHGEPHPGNVLNTSNGPLFVDIETCCRGPVEFDLAHVPEEVSERYPNADQSCSASAEAWCSRWSPPGAGIGGPAPERARSWARPPRRLA